MKYMPERRRWSEHSLGDCEAVQYRLSRIMSVRVIGQTQNLIRSISLSVILSPVRS